LKEDDDVLREEELKSAIENKQVNLLEGISDICFVTMGKIEEFIFFDIIRPSIEQYGLRSLRSQELLVTQGAIMDNIRTTILQCRLVIAEVTDGNPNVMYELGLAIENKKSIILLSQTDVPSSLTAFPHIIYENTAEGLNMLSSKFQSEIKKVLFENPLIQAKELMDRGYFSPAIVTIMSYLELSISNIISRIEDLPTRKRNFRSMINRLVELKIMDTQQMQMLSQWRVIRNDILHHNIYPTVEQTQEVINGVKGIVDFLKLIETPAYLWWRVLNDQDRKVLIEKFLLTLYRQSKKATKEATTIAAKRIFDAMGLRAYSDIITPMIVKSLEVDGYITVADGDKVQLTEKGQAESKELLEK
jgi:hypothetical protein